MKQSEATELLDQRIKDVFLVAHPTLSYALNNETFRPAARPFAVFIVAGVTSEPRSQGPAGSRRYEYKGTFVAQLFGDLDKGTRELDLLVDSVRSVFSGKHLSTAGDPLWTKGAVVANPIARDGLSMVTVQIGFTFFNLE